MSLNLDFTDLPDTSLQVLIKQLTFTENLTLCVLSCVFSYHNYLVTDTFITAIIISGCFPGISINVSFINDRRITMEYSDLVGPK